MHQTAVFIRLRRALICGAIAAAWFGGVSTPHQEEAKEARAVQAVPSDGTTQTF